MTKSGCTARPPPFGRRDDVAESRRGDATGAGDPGAGGRPGRGCAADCAGACEGRPARAGGDVADAGELRGFEERARHMIAIAPQALAPIEPEAKAGFRSEEHTSELQSIMRNSYAAFCLKKKNT